MRSVSVSVSLLASFAVVLVLGCERGGETRSPEDGAAVAADASAGQGNGEGDGEAGGEQAVANELPASLLGSLRERGADADGRLLTVSARFIATAACSDCGAPSYLQVLAVRCRDDEHCEVLTEQCEGTIERAGEALILALTPIEGQDPEGCVGYSGTFDRAE